MRWPYNTFMMEQTEPAEQLKTSDVGKGIDGQQQCGPGRYGCLVVSGIGEEIDRLLTHHGTSQQRKVLTASSQFSHHSRHSVGGWRVGSHPDEAAICTALPSFSTSIWGPFFCHFPVLIVVSFTTQGLLLCAF